MPPVLPPHLETEHYHLTRLAAADVSALFTHFADPEVTRYLDVGPITDLAEARAIVEWSQRVTADGAGGRWAIRTRDGRWVGTAGFDEVVRDRSSRAYVAYDLGPDWWGHGVMNEVMPALLRTGFVDLDVYRIESFVLPGNERSYRVLARHGFQYEGVLRGWGHWRGRDWDVEIWALLRDEWSPPSA